MADLVSRLGKFFDDVSTIVAVFKSHDSNTTGLLKDAITELEEIKGILKKMAK